MLARELSTRIAEALRGLQYGSIQLIVHEAQIVRIERVERLRLTVSSEAASLVSGRPTPSQEVRRHDAEDP